MKKFIYGKYNKNIINDSKINLHISKKTSMQIVNGSEVGGLIISRIQLKINVRNKLIVG